MDIEDLHYFQEVFNCKGYLGDPGLQKIELARFYNGGSCILTLFIVFAHNGTHVDASYHFYDDGKTLCQVDVSQFICYVCVSSNADNILVGGAERIYFFYETEQ